MATIISDPTTLISGGDSGTAFAAPLSLDTTAKTITITPGSGVLPLAADGVTGQALYSALKILWKNNSTYIKFPFPMEAITPEQFEFINGWAPANDVTRKSLRTCGWVERNTSNAIVKMFAGVVSLGSLGSTDQPYYQQVSSTTAPVNFSFLGPVNEAVQILDDPNGDGSYVDGYDRRTYMKLFAREYQKTYAAAQLSDIGVTSMTYIVYRFPLANASDSIKVTAAGTGGDYDKVLITWYRDAANSNALYNVRGDMAASTAYVKSDVVKDTGNSRWYKCILGYTSAGSPIQPSSDASHWSAYEGEKSFDGGTTYYPYTIVIDADNTVAASASGVNTTGKIYERIQYQLRQATDIDDGGSGSITGKTADSLLRFVGDTLVTSSGVFIESINSNDVNSIEFYDSTGTKRTYPYTAAGTLSFNANLVADVSAIYRVYYTQLQNATRKFGAANAVLVKDNSNADLSGTVSGSATKGWTFAYDGNSQTETQWQASTTYVAGDEYKNGSTWYRVTTGYTSGGTFGATDTTNSSALNGTSDGPSATIVAIGLSTGQYVSTTAKLLRATGQNIGLVSSLERNYVNA